MNSPPVPQNIIWIPMSNHKSTMTTKKKVVKNKQSLVLLALIHKECYPLLMISLIMVKSDQPSMTLTKYH
uniref:Uncharacterized protein n=1 Tax=Lotus japonicus TaxID=34305 RepID=I3S6X3_LOTJA|nr:unknown [Lotus japonicus]